MTPIDERTDHALREALGRIPRPRHAAGLAPEILRRAAARERERGRQRRTGRRVLLAGYWVAAAFASLWLLARLPLPAWAGAAAWACALALVPAGFAIALWPRLARELLTLALRPLAPPLER
jgi:hypothetical protein